MVATQVTSDALIESLEALVDEGKAELVDLECECEAYDEEVGQLRATLADLTLQLDGVKAENAELSEANAFSALKIGEMEAEVVSLLGQLEACEGTLHNAQMERTLMQASQHQLGVELDDLRAVNTKLDEDLLTKQSAYDEVANRLIVTQVDLEESKTAHQREIQEAKERFQDQLCDLVKAKEQIGERYDALVCDHTALNDQLTALQTDHAAALAKVTESEEWCGKLSEDYIALEASYFELHTQSQAAQEQRDAYQKQVAALVAEKADLEEQVLTIEAEKAGLFSEIAMLKADAEDSWTRRVMLQTELDAKIAVLEGEKATLSEEVSTLTKLAAENVTKQVLLETELKSLVAASAVKGQEIAALTVQVAEISERSAVEICRLQDQHREDKRAIQSVLLSQHASALAGKDTEHSEALATIHAQYTATLIDKDRELVTLTTTYNTVLAQKSALGASLTQCQQDLVTSQSELTGIRSLYEEICNTMAVEVNNRTASEADMKKALANMAELNVRCSSIPLYHIVCLLFVYVYMHFRRLIITRAQLIWSSQSVKCNY